MTSDYRIMYIRDKFNQRIGALAISLDRKAKKIKYQLSMVHPIDTIVHEPISLNQRDADALSHDINIRKVKKTRVKRIPFNAGAAQVLAVERLMHDPYTTSMSLNATSHEITAKVMEHMKTVSVPSRAKKFAKMWLNVYYTKRILLEELEKKSNIQKKKEEDRSVGSSHFITDHRNGSKSYFFNGKRHRANGPAVEYADGRKEYWYNGQPFNSQRELDEYVFNNDSVPEPMPSLKEDSVKKSSKKKAVKKTLVKKKAAKKSSAKSKKKSSKKTKPKTSSSKKATKSSPAKTKEIKKPVSNSSYISLLHKALKTGPNRAANELPFHMNRRSFT